MSNKPKCPECGSDTLVKETRPGDGRPIYYYRSRKCCNKDCAEIFTTLEIYSPQQVIPDSARRSFAGATADAC